MKTKLIYVCDITLAAEDYLDESIENNPQAIAQRTVQEIKKYWQGTERIKVANVIIGKRPIPQDCLPIIGRTAIIDGLYNLSHAFWYNACYYCRQACCGGNIK